jgi:hypothetical protein
MNAAKLPLPAAAYHADPAIKPSLSNSIAQILIDQSPMHAWLQHPRLNPNYEREQKNEFDLGSAAHVMLLEGRDDCIVQVAADNWRTNAAKEQRAAAQANGQYAVLARQYDDIVNMVSAAKKFINTTELAGIFDKGESEQTIVWQDPSGIWCRCRPDRLSADMSVCLDYKCTTTAQPDAFIMQIGRMGYDLQAEFYIDGVRDYTGEEPTFVFLAQENKEPYACSLVALSNTYREVGKAKVKQAKKIWAKCMADNSFPGYSNLIHYGEPKPWDLIKAEQAISEAEEVDL